MEKIIEQFDKSCRVAQDEEDNLSKIITEILNDFYAVVIEDGGVESLVEYAGCGRFKFASTHSLEKEWMEYGLSLADVRYIVNEWYRSPDRKTYKYEDIHVVG